MSTITRSGKTCTSTAYSVSMNLDFIMGLAFKVFL